MEVIDERLFYLLCLSRKERDPGTFSLPSSLRRLLKCSSDCACGVFDDRRDSTEFYFTGSNSSAFKFLLAA